MTPLTRASVGLEPTRSGRCPAHTPDPTATLSSSTDFPVSSVIRPTLLPPISQRDEEGFSSCATRPMSPCCHLHPVGVTNRLSQITVRHAVFARSLRARPPRIKYFSGPHRVRFLRPGDSQPSRRWRCRWASEIRFPSSLPPCYKALALTLAGLTPAERVRLGWTHNDQNCSVTIGYPSTGASVRPTGAHRHAARRV